MSWDGGGGPDQSLMNLPLFHFFITAYWILVNG
jgi:hypothetical protein